MNIIILGTGAMAALFGGYLSVNNNVYLLGRNKALVEKINSEGVRIREQDGSVSVFHPHAACDVQGLSEADLMIVFVKSMATEEVLEKYRGLIGTGTYLMTLQNGAGHEEKLLKYADENHVIIGSTQHNSSVIEPGFINHGGGGKTGIGSAASASAPELFDIAENFSSCGFECSVSDKVKDQIWNKLFLNTSASSLTAVLQCPLGYVVDDPFTRSLMHKLAHEAVMTANAEGCGPFDEAAVVSGIENVLEHSKNGYTSIYADIKAGRHTEVDTISGYVVRTAEKLGISVPYHDAVVTLIHAMEGK